jgi:hypothetical protein
MSDQGNRANATARSGRRTLAAGVAVLATLALTGSAALAHIERPAYWPDPTADTSVHPAAGGRVPKARTLASALDPSNPGKTRVVCKSSSLDRALHSIQVVETKGYKLRPTLKSHAMSAAAGDRLAALNRRFFDKCRYRSVQKAVFASRNNDRVVVMPGVYAEHHSRKQPTDDPACQQYLTDTDFGGGGPVGLSYRYQWNCPNDQSLVAVLGRKPSPDAPPPPQADRHGIPDEGPCIRCNLQLEGTGPRPEDTVIDSGKVSAGNGGPSGIGSKKDVALKVDRADGFVLRNMTIRHAKEHDLYVLETDGYLLDHVKFFYAGEYGHLTFADDHGLTKNCEGVGNGDSAVYPGGAPDSADDTAPNAPDDRDTSFYPHARLNQKITRCDLHHNNLGYSGTMGNATHVVHNNFFHNTTGIATDSFFAGGHPGFPQSAAVFEKNNIYSNNFNDYAPDSDVESSVGVPLGTGILIAGGNADVVRQNHIWNNWRRGAMLLAVPDAVSCPPGSESCTPSALSSTSYNNRYYDNTMGLTQKGKVKPNGVDFWWDEFPTNSGNCWFNNIGTDGTNGSWTGDPARFATPNMSIPGFLPEDCSAVTNAGLGDPAKEATLLLCAEAAIGDPSCEWYVDPGKPGSKRAAAVAQRERVAARDASRNAKLASPACDLIADTVSCAGFESRP